jgi:hypothetical protein
MTEVKDNKHVFEERDFKFWFPVEMKKGNKAGEIRIGGVATDRKSVV